MQKLSCVLYVQKKKTHDQLLAYHLLQNLRNALLWMYILQRKDFTPYDRSHYKILCYNYYAIQKILLHIIDHATRFSATVILASKKPGEIVNAIVKYWVVVYVTVDNFSTDNEGKFINKELMTLCEVLNIKVPITRAKSPWSNRIVQQHNLVLSEMLNKVLEKNRCSLDTALVWYLNAAKPYRTCMDSSHFN